MVKVNKGLSSKVRYALKSGKIKGHFTVEVAAEHFGVPKNVMSCTLARLARVGELGFTGWQGHRQYFLINKPIPKVLTLEELETKAADPIEILLDAMAKAEPILRKLSEARKLLTD